MTAPRRSTSACRGAGSAPDSDRQRIVEHLFRALTDINAEGEAIRCPQTFAELVAVTGSDEPTLEAIIDHFRAEGTSFLTPYGDAPIKPGTLIDISHEDPLLAKDCGQGGRLAAARVSRRPDLENAPHAGATGRNALGRGERSRRVARNLAFARLDRALRRWMGARSAVDGPQPHGP
jgi:hypothetical protein